MKYITYLACLLLSTQVFSQKKETFYDYNWKPCEPLLARFYSTIEKTDSGWLRYDYFLGNKQLQMKAIYEDSACNIRNGRGVFYYANGNIAEVGNAIHNKREGIYMDFYSDGNMMDSATYHNGVPIGNKLSWHRNGFSEDSISHFNDSMDVHMSWFDNGVISSAGFLLNGKMYGKWQFFHKNGNMAAMETYKYGKLVAKQYYGEDGLLKNDTTNIDRRPEFKGGMKGWIKYLENKLDWPYGYKFENGNMAVVVIEMMINEDGKIEFAEVKTPFHPEFDKIALKTVQSSPQWQPAIEHNRFIKYWFRQSVTFQQPE